MYAAGKEVEAVVKKDIEIAILDDLFKGRSDDATSAAVIEVRLSPGVLRQEAGKGPAERGAR